MTDTDRQHRVNATEAAAILGVSERTVWRRVKAGELEIDRSVTPHLIDLGDYLDNDNDNDNDVSDTPKQDPAGLVARLRVENERLLAELEHKDEIIDRMDREHNRLWQAHAQALRALPKPEPEAEAQAAPPSWLTRLWPWGRGEET